MRTWAFVSQKGGSGKSTLSTQLAVYAGEMGEVVCLLDLDEQASSMLWSGVREETEPTVLPAKPEHMAAVIEQAPKLGATMMILDTAPHTSAGALAAIRAADLIICPTKPSLLDIGALQDTVRLLDLSGQRDKAVVVVNQILPHGIRATFDDAADNIRRMGLRVCKNFIGNRQAFIEAINRGKGVTEIAKADKSASEIRALWAELVAMSAANTKSREKVKA